jgi:hypothetical protein
MATAASTGAGDIAVNAVAWLPCFRLIATRFPTVGLFDAIADPADLDVVFAIEAMTNPRLRQELGELSMVEPAERLAGPGATLIMAAFMHLNPLGSRFSDGSWGVYYAAQELDTAIAEAGHHRARFLARTAEPEIDIDLRLIQADLRERFHDLRGRAADHPAICDPQHYGASQALARQLREAARGPGAPAGIVYDSLRHEGGSCIAVFRPKALSAATAPRQLALHWDGRRVTHWFEKGSPHAL